jgi:hypothetical protein
MPTTLTGREKSEVEEIRRLLAELKTTESSEDYSKGKTSSFECIHTDIIDDSFRENERKNHLALPKKEGLLNYLFNFSTSQGTASDPEGVKELRPIESDSESIHEDYGSEAKTIFRSSSFDSINSYREERHGEALNVETFMGRVVNEEVEDTTDSSHRFHLDEFSDTFNLDEYDGTTNPFTPKESYSPDSSLKSRKSIENLSVLRSNEAQDQDASFYPSISSGGSLHFKDFSMDDVLGDLKRCSATEEFKKEEYKSQHRSYLDEDGLTLEESKLVNAIVTKLKKQLSPTLTKLSEVSDKYETLKTLYKLPSISNLNEEVRLKYSKKGKKFNLEFHHDVIRDLVHEEKGKAINRRKVGNYSMISAQEQIRLNFNKYRQLNPITEERSFEVSTSGKEEEVERGKLECKRSNYQKSRDTRTVDSLLTDELIEYLKLIKDGRVKDINRVGHLVSLFEVDQTNIINRLDNMQLKGAILSELNRRKVI